jgi:hypothetical protein
MAVEMTTTRIRMAVLAAVVGGAMVLAGCGGDDDDSGQPAEPAQSSAPVSGTFVGRAEDDKTAVAVVAEGGGDGRAISVYLCDGRPGLSEWYVGKAEANSATLKSKLSSSTVTTELSADGASGTATLPDGRELAFDVERASGPAGLFDVTLDGNTGTGTSTTGQKLEVAYDGKEAVPTVDGEQLTAGPLGTFDSTLKGPQELRVIVLPDGRAIGASKNRPAGDPGFTWQEID